MQCRCNVDCNPQKYTESSSGELYNSGARKDMEDAKRDDASDQARPGRQTLPKTSHHRGGPEHIAWWPREKPGCSVNTVFTAMRPSMHTKETPTQKD